MAAQPVKLNLKIIQGSTFRETFRWESSEKVYVPITNITKSAPMVVQADNHGVPPGWRAKITGATGMKEVNSEDYRVVTGITANSLTFNAVNALNYTTYIGGGVLEYNKPIDLTGVTARMQIREKITSSSVIEELTTENSKIFVDNTLKTITLLLPASTTMGYTFTTAVYSLEIVRSGEVIPMLYGSVSLDREVTR